MSKISGMMRKLVILSLQFFVFFTGYGQILFEQHIEKNQAFTFHQNSDSITNFILQEIARSQQKSVQTTRIHLSYTLFLQVKQSENDQIEILVEIRRPYFNGDVFYRNINIEQILLPFSANFQCALECNKIPYVVIQDSNVSLQGSLGYYQVIRKNFLISEFCHEWTLGCSSIQLRWNTETIENFRQITQIINEYYASERILEDIEEQLQQIDMNKTDKYPFFAVIMSDLQKKIDQLKARQYAEKLELWKHDPIHFSERLRNIENRLISLKQLIAKQIEHFDRVLFEKAMHYKISQQFDSMLWYLDKSILFNPVFAPSLTEKAMWLAQTDQVDSALTLLLYVVQFTFIPEYYKNQFLVYIPIFMSITQNNVDALLTQEEFNQAEKIISKAIALTRHNDFKNYYNTFEQYLARAKYGLYRSILVVVERALEFKKVQLAYEYTKRAISYQRDNEQYIISPIEAQRYYKPIVNLCMQLIDQFRSTKQFERAQDLTEWLHHVCDSLQPFCNQHILDSLHQLNTIDLFLKRLDDIARHIEKKEYSLARTRMHVLEEFMKQYPFLLQNQRYLELQKRLHEHTLQQELSYAMQNIQHGFWLPAWDALYHAKKIQMDYNLDAQSIDSLVQTIADDVINAFFLDIERDSILIDPEIIYGKILNFEQQLSLLQVKLSNEQRTLLLQVKFWCQDKICKKIAPHIEKNFKELDALIAKQEFEKAYQFIQQIRKAFDQYDYCHIHRQKLNDYEYRLNEALIYVHQQQLLKGFLMTSAWESALKQIEILNTLASQPVLQNWNLKTYTVVDVVKQQKSIEFTLFAFEHLFELKRWDECFELLEILKKLNYPLKNSKNLQEELGKKIAVRDKLNNPTANYKLNILKYTEGDEYFSYFSKAYRKTWKKHKL